MGRAKGSTANAVSIQSRALTRAAQLTTAAAGALDNLAGNLQSKAGMTLLDQALKPGPPHPLP